MSVTMTRQEREQFLAGVHVGVLSVASPEGGGPLAVPVWYSYQPGGTLDVITGDRTRKAAAIRAAERFSLGPEGGNDYVSANPTGGQIVFRMTPGRWLTVDQTKAYG